ncbi:hypothetical protein CASFOL_038496 [Castilleja foliolosa]|uniref:Phosphatidic acid phosphatase type 2/haloperoxidase domain-containing protein n=1 Tax=Castilleja foliolosa TaxID=1961234 RepID=A0ABD3BN85_9LAMI
MGLILSAPIHSIFRVYLGYHTVAQVFAGAALGVVLGGAWFWVVNNLLWCRFQAIEESAFGRFPITSLLLLFLNHG